MCARMHAWLWLCRYVRTLSDSHLTGRWQACLRDIQDEASLAKSVDKEMRLMLDVPGASGRQQQQQAEVCGHPFPCMGAMVNPARRQWPP